MRFLVMMSLLCGSNLGAWAQPGQLWSEPREVVVQGYDGTLMEPGISPDGRIVFFNNSNADPNDTDVFWAVRVGEDPATFDFQGAVDNLNRPGVLDGTPAFTGTRLSFVSEQQVPPTSFWGSFSNGAIEGVQEMPIADVPQPVYFSLGVEFPGQRQDTIVFCRRSTQDQYFQDIQISEWDGEQYTSPDNWREIMANVNTDDAEYAPELSTDLLELWFTRVLLPGPVFQIMGATRNDASEPFGQPFLHPTIPISPPAEFEAPTLTADDRFLYYHCRQNMQEAWGLCVVERL